MAEESEEKKIKRPSARKRLIQNEKKRLINKSFKSRVRSVLRNFDAVLSSRDQASSQKALGEVYSMMDKGVKRGIFKPNKAGRTKARLAARLAAITK